MAVPQLRSGNSTAMVKITAFCYARYTYCRRRTTVGGQERTRRQNFTVRNLLSWHQQNYSYDVFGRSAHTKA